MPQFLGVDIHVWADALAFAFAFAACILCIVQIHHHIYHNHHPETRKYIIRILLMVIVYCIESWCGLYIPSLSLYLDTLRDTYEALVIYSFYQLLIYSLGGYENVQHALCLIPMNTFPHFFPFKYCCKPWTFTLSRSSSSSFLRNTTIGVLQYCLIQPLCAIIVFILQLTETYHEGEFSYKYGYPYIAFIRSISQSWAIYCLVLFYLSLKKQPIESDGYQLFETIRPIPKFLCIKGVVFFTYWQSVTIALLIYLNLIPSTESWTSSNIATGLQDTLICIEMFIAAIAHIYAFRVDDFQESGYTPLIPPHNVLFAVANVTDILVDASQHMLKRPKNRLYDDDNDIIDDSDNELSSDEYQISKIDDDKSNSNTDNELNKRKKKKKKKKKMKKMKYIKRNKNKNSINSKPTSLESELNDDQAL